MKKNKIAILLTACVRPNGMVYTKLQDEEIRKQQYKESLCFYLHETTIPIVFVENTNTDFSAEFSKYINSGRLEYIAFNGNDFDKKKGKGYGEAMIIKQACEKSTIIRNSTYILKITGRIKLMNCNDIISSRVLRISNNICRCSFLMEGFIITTAMLIPMKMLEAFSEIALIRINDQEGVFFEHVLHDFLRSQKDIILLPFVKPLIINGISGTHNRPYIIPTRTENIYMNINGLSFFYRCKDKLILSVLFRLLKKILNIFCRVAKFRLRECY
ncbi:MAG: hypothetical protein J5905_00910 [Prevotella sp.]|nr:hypothetical protein [Prevotella sp.]